MHIKLKQHEFRNLVTNHLDSKQFRKLLFFSLKEITLYRKKNSGRKSISMFISIKVSSYCLCCNSFYVFQITEFTCATDLHE